MREGLRSDTSRASGRLNQFKFGFYRRSGLRSDPSSDNIVI